MSSILISANYYQARQYNTVIRRLTGRPAATPALPSRLLLSLSRTRRRPRPKPYGRSTPRGPPGRRGPWRRSASSIRPACNAGERRSPRHTGSGRGRGKILPDPSSGAARRAVGARYAPPAFATRRAALSGRPPRRGTGIRRPVRRRAWSFTAVAPWGRHGRGLAAGTRGAAVTIGLFTTLVYAGNPFGGGTRPMGSTAHRTTGGRRTYCARSDKRPAAAGRQPARDLAGSVKAEIRG